MPKSSTASRTPSRLSSRHPLGDRVGVAQQRRLGELEHQPLRRQLAGRQRRADVRDQARVRELGAREVDAERERVGADAARARSAACMQAVRRTQRPSGSISRLSSAIGMNSPGSSRPRVGCSQRTSASTPASRSAAQLEDRLVVQRELGVAQRRAPATPRAPSARPSPRASAARRPAPGPCPWTSPGRARGRRCAAGRRPRCRRSRSRCWPRCTPRGPRSRTARSSPRGSGWRPAATRGLVDVLEQDHELVAAEARRGVDGADARRQARRPPRAAARRRRRGRACR